MCDLCVQPDEKTLLLEIREPLSKSAAKYEAGVAALTKAFGYDSDKQQKEVSPYKSVRDLEKLSKDRVEAALLALYNMVVTSWIDVEKASSADTFVLNNRIFLNPKTGKPLTKAQWAIIKKDIMKAFNYIYAKEEERIALHAMSLGKVLKGMPLNNALNFGHATLKEKIDDAMRSLENPEWKNAAQFAQQHAAENIVELKTAQFHAFHDTIQTAIKNHANPGALKAQLFDTFGNMNRDWRRIAETEIANAQNNGQLLAQLDANKGKQTFVQGIAVSGACAWCRNEVDGKTFALLSAPPSSGGDKVTIDGETYTAIWPGKDNVGRSRRNWWVAAGAQHPHCRCSWLERVLGFESWEAKIRAALDAATEASTARRNPKAFSTAVSA